MAATQARLFVVARFQELHCRGHIEFKCSRKDVSVTLIERIAAVVYRREALASICTTAGRPPLPRDNVSKNVQDA